MSVFDAIIERFSIRNYKTDKVPFDVVVKIVDAARMAPSWGNKQSWKFIIVDSRVEKKLLGKASGQDNIAKACEDAPFVVVLCANAKESGVKNSMEYYLFDCGLAMENLVLAAQSEGLSTCIVGWFDEKTVKGLLNVPEDIRIVAFTPLGYSKESKGPRKRKKQEEAVFHNFWGKTVSK